MDTLNAVSGARGLRDDARAPRVDVLVCGAADRGDDGAPLRAACDLERRLPEGVRLRLVGRLDVDDLLDLPVETGVVIVDAATGIPPGSVVDLPIEALPRVRGCRPRSSHALGAPEVVGLAALLRGGPLRGRIVAVGGEEFGLGMALSPRVAEVIPDLVAAVLEAVESLRR